MENFWEGFNKVATLSDYLANKAKYLAERAAKEKNVVSKPVKQLWKETVKKPVITKELSPFAKQQSKLFNMGRSYRAEEVGSDLVKKI